MNSKFGSLAKPAPQIWSSEAALKQFNLNKLNDASGFKSGDVRRSQKPNFEFICVYSGKGAKYSKMGKRISKEEILREDLKNYSLFIMPGGRDVPYMENLKGEPNQKIREFVENGGTYLGICAGAYYGSSFVEFAKGTSLEVIGKRELRFFNGKAAGPIFGSFEYDSEKGAKIVKLGMKDISFYSYYNGGCLFEGDFSNVKILARYLDLKDEPPAIIECPIKKGKAILSGVHLETHLLDSNKKKVDLPIDEKIQWIYNLS